MGPIDGVAEASEDEAWASLLDQLEELKKGRTVKVLRYPFRRCIDGRRVCTVLVAGCTERWVWRHSRWVRTIAGYRSR